MNLSSLSKQELLEELEKREASESTLIFGTICDYPDGPMVEIFRKVESPDDLPHSQGYILRARFNSHRNYRRFYFKTDSFELLSQRLQDDPKGFSKWLIETPSVQMEPI